MKWFRGLLIKILIQRSENIDDHELFAVDICEKEDVFVNENTLTGQSLMRQKILEVRPLQKQLILFLKR